MTTVLTTPVSRVIDAFQANAMPAGLFSDDATAWHNFDELDLRIAESFGMVAAILAVVPDFRFDERRHHPAAGDVSVAQYILRGTLPDGSQLRIPGCLVAHTEDDRVVRIEEYLDSAQLAPLVAAVGG